MSDPIKDTLLARVYDVAIESPLEKALKLSAAAGVEVYLKREDLQPVHSFKLRGAYNKIVQLTAIQKKKGVIAASAGNHAQGVALAAQKLGLKALIVMPRTTPAIKVEAVKSYGATVELQGDNYSEAFDYCQKRIQETGMTFVHPFDDPLVIAGQGTIGREILEQLPDVTHIFVPVGGGGLIAGIAQFVKAVRPEVKIISVEPADSNALQLSLKAKKRIILPFVGIFADGVAVKQIGEYTYKTALKYVDNAVTVTTDQMCAGIKAIFEDTRAIVEPAGALAVAAIMHTKLPKNAKAVAICSGANMSFEKLQLIAERTLLGSGKEAIYSITLPEKHGALKKLCREVVNGQSITEFSYRLNKRSQANIFLGVTVASSTEKNVFENKMKKDGYGFTDLSSDDLTKEHIRHMIGGVSREAKNEHIFQVNFPERPGALADFLQAMGSDFNISLFHYRSTASDDGNVLIGFEASDEAALLKKMAGSTYPHKQMSGSCALDLFIA